MKLHLALAFLFMTALAQAKMVDKELVVASRCSTADTDILERILIENRLDVERAKRGQKPINVHDIPTTTIPVYVHVLAKDQTVDGGNVSDKKVQEQITYLSAAYKQMNITFELKGIDRTIDATWANFTAGEKFIKEKLYKGDKRTLNLYVAGTDDGVLGWAYFPWEYDIYPQNDGVVIHFQTLPGGAFKDFNEGGTTVHEVGHWLGLYHVFQDGCMDGDQVADTPAQRQASFGCPQVASESCKKGLKDSIHNFMDYSNDVCMEGFTPGQIQRVHDSLSAYRSL